MSAATKVIKLLAAGNVNGREVKRRADAAVNAATAKTCKCRAK
ncbi:MAG: hypothetical protein ACM3X6_08620 [Patescibacteria group bacterium]